MRIRTAAIFASLCLALPAAAATRHHHPAQAPAPAETVTRQLERSCPPMCDNDRNPCDPITFKLADGRCAPEERL